MAYLATGSNYFASQSAAGDLTQAFNQAASALTIGYSVLTPECPAGSTPPNC